MKKLLIATTALVATTGMSMAQDLSLSGSARFGLVYDEGNEDSAGEETRIEQRFRLNVRGTTMSDNGIEFSSRIRFESNESNDDSISGTGNGAAEFTVQTGGFRLDLGNTSDIIDGGSIVDYYGFGVGFTSFLEQSSNFEGFPLTGFGADDEDTTTITVQYGVGDFNFGFTYRDNQQDASAAGQIENDIQTWMIGARYTFGNYGVGFAYGNEDGDEFVTGGTAAGARGDVDNDFWVITFDGEVGAFGFSVIVGDSDEADDTMYGGSLNYDFSAATSIRFVVSEGGADSNDTSYGIGFRHGLGGGVTLAGGVGSNKTDDTVADLGVTFSF